jgi:hypothetical protein
MKGLRTGALSRSARPQLLGPGVLGKRYDRSTPSPGGPLSTGTGPDSAGAGASGADGGEAPASAPARTGFWASSLVVPGFIAVQILCQLALLAESFSALRVVFRIFSFGASLAMLVLVPGRTLRHPALPYVLAAMVFTSLGLFHPETGSYLAAAAQLGIQFSVMVPLVWVTRLRMDAPTFRRTLALLFLFNAASAALGVLQVYFPGQFQPALSSVIGNLGEAYNQSLQFEVASGQRIFRPFGLTDTPGGASTGAFYSVLLGGGFLISSKRGVIRALSIGGIFLGVVCLYLCQVRAVAVMLLVCMLAIAGVLALNGRLMRLTKLVLVVGGFAIAGFGWAVALGGDAITQRWGSLVEADAGEVYYSNRGYFLEGSVGYFLPEFPLGAGLGRYGMANAYFGDRSRSSLWAEIQWTAWIFDGGIPVLVLYPLGLVVALIWALRLAFLRDDSHEFWLWGTILVGYNLGAIAITFSYPFFMSQSGMVFWLLNAALFGAYQQAARLAPRARADATLHPHRR